MAQLELASLASATAGPAAKTIGMVAPVEAGEGALPPTYSFRLLLQVDLPENPAATAFGELATVTAGSTALDPQIGQSGLAMIDPADPAEAAEQLMVAALTEGLASDEGEGDPGELTDGATDAGAGDAEIGAAENLPAQGAWLGLPLVIDARAALRNVGSPDAAKPSSTAAADPTRLRLLSRATAAVGQKANNGDGSAQSVGGPAAQAPGDIALTSLDVAAVAGIGSPRPAPGSTAEISGADLPDALGGSPASALEKLKNPADPDRAAGAAVTEIMAEEAVAVGQANAPVKSPDRPSPATAIRAEPGPAASAAPHQAGGDRQPAAPANSHSLQWPLRLAESLNRIGSGLSAVEQTASAGNAIAGDETTVAATAKSDEDAIRPLPPAAQNPTSLLAVNPANGRPTEAVASLAPARPDEIVREAAAIRVAEPAGPASGGTPTQAGASSSTPTRPEAAASPASLPTTPDALNLNQKKWERTLGHQLNWMVNNRLHEAEIKVNPPDLGPLEVRVSQHHNQTNVTFFSHEAAVREALENALPRLREMLDGQGINLNQAQVSDQSLARQQAGAGEQPSYGQRDGGRPVATPGAEAAMEAEESSRPRSRNLLGTVDDYA